MTIHAEHPMQVFVQLTSGDPVPTVVERGTTGFTVRVADKTSDATFSWRTLAKRKGHEADRMVETDILDRDPNVHPEPLRPEGIRQAPDGPRAGVTEPVTAPERTAALREAPEGGAR